MKKPEEKFELKEKFPATLDIVKIDGRWAQIATEAVDLKFITVKFLDDGTMERIDLNEYYLAHEFGVSVDSLKEIFGESLSPTEAERIRWGPEQEEHPHLKGLVQVFGEYKRPA